VTGCHFEQRPLHRTASRTGDPELRPEPWLQRFFNLSYGSKYFLIYFDTCLSFCAVSISHCPYSVPNPTHALPSVSDHTNPNLLSAPDSSLRDSLSGSHSRAEARLLPKAIDYTPRDTKFVVTW